MFSLHKYRNAGAKCKRLEAKLRKEPASLRQNLFLALPTPTLIIPLSSHSMAVSLKILPLRNWYFVDYYKIKFNLLQFFCKTDGRVGPLHKVYSTTALSISVGLIGGRSMAENYVSRSLNHSFAVWAQRILKLSSWKMAAPLGKKKNPYMGNSGHLVYSVSSCFFFFNIMLLNLDLTNRSNPTGMMDKSLQLFLFWILIQCLSLSFCFVFMLLGFKL